MALEGEGVVASVQGMVGDNHLDLALIWSDESWKPSAAHVALDATEWPGEAPPLWQALQPKVSLEAVMQEALWTTSATASGEWQISADAPARLWSAQFAGEVQSDAITLARAEAQLPFLQVDLTAPVSLSRSTWTPTQPAELTWRIEANELPPSWGVRGSVAGRARLDRRASLEGLTFELNLEAEDFAVAALESWPVDLSAAEVALDGELDAENWSIPAWRLDSQAGLALTGSAEGLTSGERWAATIAGDAAGDALAPLLPTSLNISDDAVRFRLDLEQQPEALVHRGELMPINLAWANLEPAEVALSWEGRDRQLGIINAQLAQTGNTVTVSAAVDLTDLAQMSVDLASLRAEEANQVWQLREPVTLRRLEDTWQWSRLEIASTESTFHTEGVWDPEGSSRIVLEVSNLAHADVAAWWPHLPEPVWSIKSFAADLQTIIRRDDTQVWTGAVQADATLGTADSTALPLKLDLLLEESALVFHEATVLLAPDAPLSMTGRLPVSLRATRTQAVAFELNPAGECALEGRLPLLAALPEWLADKAPFALGGVAGQIRLAGPLHGLAGSVEVEAATLAWKEAQAPVLHDVRLDLSLQPRLVELRSLSARVADAEASSRLTGRLEGDFGAWVQTRDTTAIWEDSRLDLQTEDWPLAALGGAASGFARTVGNRLGYGA